jgi:predicted house-cleaning noncanonical NTP pyrophosphatase (MazG superfamily)
MYLLYFINFLYFLSFSTSFFYLWTLLKYVNKNTIKITCREYGAMIKKKLNENQIRFLKKYILTELLIIADIISGLSEGLIYNKKKIVIKHKSQIANESIESFVD